MFFWLKNTRYLETSQTRKAFDLFGSALTYNPRDASGLMGAGFIIQESVTLPAVFFPKRPDFARQSSSWSEDENADLHDLRLPHKRAEA